MKCYTPEIFAVKTLFTPYFQNNEVFLIQHVKTNTMKCYIPEIFAVKTLFPPYFQNNPTLVAQK